MTGAFPGPDDRYQPPPGGHWQYQDPYAAPPAAPPSAFPYAPPAPYPLPVMAMQPVYTLPLATNGLATAAMVLGIISIPGAIAFFFDLPIAIVGLILGIVGLRRANRMPPHARVGKGRAIAGIACASVGLVLSATFSVYLVREIDRCSQYAVDSPAWDRCFSNEPE